MIRKIHCSGCGIKHFVPMHPEDVVHGWQVRAVQIARAQCPTNLTTTITTYNKLAQPVGEPEVVSHTSLICDGCGEPIQNGDPCVAITMWRGPEPAAWETEYGAS